MMDGTNRAQHGAGGSRAADSTHGAGSSYDADGLHTADANGHAAQGSNDQGAGRTGKDSMLIVARIVMVIAAIGLVAAFFLPWGSADEDFREAAAQMPDIVLAEDTGLTAAEATDLSLLEYAQVYGSMGDVSAVWTAYMVIMYAAAVTAVLALVLAAAGKPIGAAVLSVLTIAVSRLLVWDFGERGVLPNASYDWGIAPTVYVVAGVVLIAAGIWMVVRKRQLKAAARA